VRCAICEHPKRAAIEARLDVALSDPDKLAELATEYELKVGTIKRHPGHPPGGPVAAPARPVRKVAPAAPPAPAPEPSASAVAPPALVVGPPAFVAAERAAAAGPSSPAPHDGKSALEHAREHTSELRRSLIAAAADDKASIQRLLTHAIGVQGRLERAEALKVEAKERAQALRVKAILKSPEWKEVERRIVDALRPFGPDALRAVARAQDTQEEPLSKAA